MTREEAIMTLKEEMPVNDDFAMFIESERGEKLNIACEMAIKALEQKPDDNYINKEDFDKLFDQAIKEGYDWANKYPAYKGIILSGMKYVLDIFKRIYYLSNKR